MIRFNKEFLNSKIEKKIKNKFIFCHFLSLFQMLFEILSLVLILPIISFFLNIDNKFISLNNFNYFLKLDAIVKGFLIFFFIILFYLIRALAQLFIFSYERKFIARIEREFKKEVFKRTIFINLNKIGKSTLANKLRDLSDVGIMTKHLYSLIKFNSGIIISSSIITFLFVFNFKVSLFFLIFFSILSTSYILLTNKFFIRSGALIRNKSSNLVNEVYNSLNSLRELIIDKKRNFFFNLFSKANSELIKTAYLSEIYQRIPRIFGELGLIFVILCTFFFFYINSYGSNEIIINLSVFVTAGIKLLPLFVQLANTRQNLVQSFYSTQKVYDVLSKNYIFNGEKHNTKQQLDIKKTINVKNLSFHYSNKKKLIENLNLTIKKKKIIGLVGESGSGKTTFINLLTGLLKPIRGTIFVDDIDIYKKLDLWHNSIGYVPQDVFLISGKVKSNIAFGIKDNEVKKNKIKKLLKICKLDNFINNKRDGINFYIREKSANISGGQKQRLGIARALYKNPKILILDEATSGIDQDNEKLILKNIKKEFKDITILLITHRLGTLKKFADEIYEIKNKKFKKI